MNIEITTILTGSIGEHMEIVFDSNTGERKKYTFTEYTMLFDKIRNVICLSENAKAKKNEIPCRIDLTSLTEYKVQTLYDMKRITLLTEQERISLLIYQH